MGMGEGRGCGGDRVRGGGVVGWVRGGGVVGIG